MLDSLPQPEDNAPPLVVEQKKRPPNLLRWAHGGSLWTYGGLYSWYGGGPRAGSQNGVGVWTRGPPQKLQIENNMFTVMRKAWEELGVQTEQLAWYSNF